MATSIVLFQQDLGKGSYFATSLFWACDCEEDFLHPLDKEQCYGCNRIRDESPDARVDDVIRYGHQVDPRLAGIVLAQADIEPIPF